ncbi:MAG: YihY/virulence factor BrkB family protein [Spirochaetaceae bacterium]|nr:MAG: YihY/virulence factor BrkB family protein [Spirochaetaceae bacterium]
MKRDKRLKKFIWDTGLLFWEAGREWQNDSAPRLSAAMAYYTALSIAPMAILLAMLATRFLGEARWDAQIAGFVEGALGAEVTSFFRGVLRTAETTGPRYLTTGIGLFAVLYGSSRSLMFLRDALNKIFGYGRRQLNRGVLEMIVGKLVTIGFTMLILLAILIVLFLSPILGAIGAELTDLVPVLRSFQTALANIAAFFGATLVFMILYRVVPAHKLRWRDVLPGSLFTAALFAAGDAIIRFYLRGAFIRSIFGAAGSFVVILLWLYFLSQIIFFGAEFTYVYLKRQGADETKSRAPIERAHETRSEAEHDA